MSKPALLLASKSKARKTMLEAAGINIEARPPDVDEDALKDSLKNNRETASDLAEALAEAKAISLSKQNDGKLILGGDQLLELDDGSMLNKPKDREDAKAHLKTLSGKTHRLHSAAAIVEQGSVTWRHVETASMTMRNLSSEFINQYVDSEWEHIQYCVGCYEIEGRGAQLFSDVKGSHFAILGLPLLPLLDYLRVRGVMLS